MRVILVWLVVFAACNEGSTRVVRWPEHRHHHDDQLDRLQVIVEAQRKEIADLERRMLAVESAAVDKPPRP